MEQVKKQITIKKNLYKKIEKIAKEKQKPFSLIVNKALDEYTKENNKIAKRKNMLKLIGIIESGTSNGSINHDKEIYG